MGTLVGRAQFMSCPARACGETAPPEPHGQGRINGGDVVCQRKSGLTGAVNARASAGLPSVCREDTSYLNTELAMAGLQPDSRTEPLDPASGLSEAPTA